MRKHQHISSHFWHNGLSLNSNSIISLRDSGFKGFHTVQNLTETNCAEVPDTMGVYVVLSTNTNVSFLSESTGGHFKGRNPAVPISELEKNWVHESEIVYIGKAGGFNSKATLKKRLRQYMRFGQGVAVGHWGGRYIWQLQHSADLVVCWKPISDTEPKLVESDMIQKHVILYGMRPFGNLTG
jgi:hypothetical protein